MQQIETVDQLSNLDHEIDLQRKFPLSWRLVIKRSIRWILIVVAVHALMIHGHIRLNENLFAKETLHSIESLSSTLLLLAKMGLFLKLLYEYMYLVLYEYSLVEGHLVVTTGVIQRTRGTIPIDLISDCTIQRNLLDLLLGLYTFTISAPSHEAQSSTFPQGTLRVEGLKTTHAVGLQDLFNRLVRCKESAVDQHEVENIVESHKEVLSLS